MADANVKRGMGWRPDYPDFRDYTEANDEVTPKQIAQGQKDSLKDMFTKMGLGRSSKAKLPAKKDLRQWCSPVEDQEDLGSCTANAGVAMVERR